MITKLCVYRRTFAKFTKLCFVIMYMYIVYVLGLGALLVKLNSKCTFGNLACIKTSVSPIYSWFHASPPTRTTV